MLGGQDMFAPVYVDSIDDALGESLDEAEKPREFFCPITGQIMHDPVMLKCDNEIYERAAIENWIKNSEYSPAGRKLPNSKSVGVELLTPAVRLRRRIHRDVRRTTTVQDRNEFDSSRGGGGGGGEQGREGGGGDRNNNGGRSSVNGENGRGGGGGVSSLIRRAISASVMRRGGGGNLSIPPRGGGDDDVKVAPRRFDLSDSMSDDYYGQTINGIMTPAAARIMTPMSIGKRFSLRTPASSGGGARRGGGGGSGDRGSRNRSKHTSGKESSPYGLPLGRQQYYADDVALRAWSKVHGYELQFDDDDDHLEFLLKRLRWRVGKPIILDRDEEGGYPSQDMEFVPTIVTPDEQRRIHEMLSPGGLYNGKDHHHDEEEDHDGAGDEKIRSSRQSISSIYSEPNRVVLDSTLDVVPNVNTKGGVLDALFPIDGSSALKKNIKNVKGNDENASAKIVSADEATKMATTTTTKPMTIRATTVAKLSSIATRRGERMDELLNRRVRVNFGKREGLTGHVVGVGRNPRKWKIELDTHSVGVFDRRSVVELARSKFDIIGGIVQSNGNEASKMAKDAESDVLARAKRDNEKAEEEKKKKEAEAEMMEEIRREEEEEAVELARRQREMTDVSGKAKGPFANNGKTSPMATSADKNKSGPFDHEFGPPETGKVADPATPTEIPAESPASTESPILTTEASSNSFAGLSTTEAGAKKSITRPRAPTRPDMPSDATAIFAKRNSMVISPPSSDDEASNTAAAVVDNFGTPSSNFAGSPRTRLRVSVDSSTVPALAPKTPKPFSVNEKAKAKAASTVDVPEPVLFRAIAKWKYKARDDEELTIPKGSEVNIIVDKTEWGEDWWIGRLGEKTGYFPRTLSLGRGALSLGRGALSLGRGRGRVEETRKKPETTSSPTADTTKLKPSPFSSSPSSGSFTTSKNTPTFTADRKVESVTANVVGFAVAQTETSSKQHEIFVIEVHWGSEKSISQKLFATMAGVGGNDGDSRSSESGSTDASPSHSFWKCYRRYSQFLKCHRILSKMMHADDVPNFPGKQFWATHDAEFLNNRRKELDRWLHAVCSAASNRPKYFVLKEVLWAFFCDPEYKVPPAGMGTVFYGEDLKGRGDGPKSVTDDASGGGSSKVISDDADSATSAADAIDAKMRSERKDIAKQLTEVEENERREAEEARKRRDELKALQTEHKNALEKLETEKDVSMSLFRKGDWFVKHGRMGRPKRNFVRVRGAFLIWRKKEKDASASTFSAKKSAIPFMSISKVLAGSKKSELLASKGTKDAPEERTFSLMLSGTYKDSLDLTAATVDLKKRWVTAFETVLDFKEKRRALDARAEEIRALARKIEESSSQKDDGGTDELDKVCEKLEERQARMERTELESAELADSANDLSDAARKLAEKESSGLFAAMAGVVYGDDDG
eukprot:g352.t1